MRRKIFAPSEGTVNIEVFEKTKNLLYGPDYAATRLWWEAKPINLYLKPTE